MTDQRAASGLEWVQDVLASRRADGLWRELTPRSASDGLLDLASNDYLGLSAHPAVVAGADEATRRWGAGSTGSRLVTGTTELHLELEARLAAFLGAGSCLVFSSGYLANLGILGALGGPDALVVADAANHASLIDGVRLSRSAVAVVGHGDVDGVRRALSERTAPRAVVVTDSLFSVTGELAPLSALHAAAQESDAWLVIDEAHALGVVGPGGRGAAAAAELAGLPDVVLTMTLSKSLGAMGGAVLGPPEIRDLLVNTARTFIFDTGLAPSSTGAALASLGLLESDPGLPGQARTVARTLARVCADVGLAAPLPEGAVVSVVLGDPGLAVAARDVCAQHGVRVGCFRPPSVPAGGSCLRMTARADLGPADMAMAERALTAVAELSSGWRTRA